MPLRAGSQAAPRRAPIARARGASPFEYAREHVARVCLVVDNRDTGECRNVVESGYALQRAAYVSKNRAAPTPGKGTTIG
jgi:hypothetical protein